MGENCTFLIPTAVLFQNKNTPSNYDYRWREDPYHLDAFTFKGKFHVIF